MARNMYGATSADFTLTSGGRVVPGATLTIWSARTGGTQITDLLDRDSVACTTVTSAADGSIVYYGPNNDKTVHWADSGQGSRVAIRPTDITGDPPVMSIGTVGTGTAAASLTGTSEAPVLNLMLPSSGVDGVNTAAIQDGAVTSAKLAAGERSRLSVWRAALDGARSGGKARIACIGDSWTYGFLATSKENEGFVTVLRGLLNPNTPVTYPGIFLPIYSAVAGSHKRSFVTLGSGWTTSVGYGIAGQPTLYAPAGTSASADIGPFWCSGFIVYYMRRSNTGTFDIQIDSETAVNVGGTGADAIMSTTVTSANTGSHTLHLKNVATERAVIMAVEPIVGAGNGAGVYLAEMGASGSKTADWIDASQPWHAGKQVWETYAPHLTVITLGLNDRINNVLPATFQANYTTIVTKALTSGSVICVVQPGNSDAAYTYPWQQYVDAIYTVAAANNVPVVDIRGMWRGDLATGAGGVYDSGDHIHPNTAGHAAIAAAILPTILGA